MKGKKRYSSYSETFELPAVNFKGIYSVEALSEPGWASDFVVKMTSEEYNGVLNIKAITGDGSPLYSMETQGISQDDQMVTITGYSYDGTEWTDIPSSGLYIKAGETCF